MLRLQIAGANPSAHRTMSAKRLLLHIYSSIGHIRAQEHNTQLVLGGALSRYLSHRSVATEGKTPPPSPQTPLQTKEKGPELVKDSSDDEASGRKWMPEVAWLSKALEPALQLYKWVSTTGPVVDERRAPPSTRSVAEILSYLQLNRISIQDWSLSDLTLGLYLIYLSQASAAKVEDLNGVMVTSDVLVQELIYHIELAKGAYKDNAAVLARHSMLRERNILKFVKDSSVMRPGYYIGIDTRNKLVVLGIRGTHTVYDLITDVVASSNQKVSFEGFSTHFGTAEAARWFLHNEMGTIRKCMEQHKGFRLRLVGHSLGGAAAALLAVMIRKRSAAELGFNPEFVSAIGFGTPPCVSKELAESCASYVTTVVLQDDIIPRLSAASLSRLRNEILETDWMRVLEKEDWKGIIDLVTNAKQVVLSVQDVARKLADYAKFRKVSNTSGILVRKDVSTPQIDSQPIVKRCGPMPEELFVPGMLYFLKRRIAESSVNGKSVESYTLWKRQPGEHFQKILLSGNLFSDHKCDSHYYALRDVLKSLPASDQRVHF